MKTLITISLIILYFAPVIGALLLATILIIYVVRFFDKQRKLEVRIKKQNKEFAKHYGNYIKSKYPDNV